MKGKRALLASLSALLLTGCVSLRLAKAPASYDSGPYGASRPAEPLTADPSSAPVLPAGETVLSLDPEALGFRLSFVGLCGMEEPWDGRAFLPFDSFQTDSGPVMYGNDRECPAALIASAEDLDRFTAQTEEFFFYDYTDYFAGYGTDSFRSLLPRWDESFFEDHVLLPVYIWMPSTVPPVPDRFELRRNKVPEASSAVLHIGFIPEPGLEGGEMECGWFALLEIPRDTAAAVSRIRAAVRNRS